MLKADRRKQTPPVDLTRSMAQVMEGTPSAFAYDPRLFCTQNIAAAGDLLQAMALPQDRDRAICIFLYLIAMPVDGDLTAKLMDTISQHRIDALPRHVGGVQ